MKPSRGLRLTAACAAIALAVTACGGSGDQNNAAAGSWSIPQQDPTATISVVAPYDPKSTGMGDVLAGFAKEHPTIKVNYQYVPFETMNSVLDSRITSKTGDPDVYWADQPRVPSLAKRGYLEDLTKQFGGLTSGLQEATVKSSSFEGKLWSVPVRNSIQILFYNKDLLAKAGVRPPSSDPSQRITWQQLKADAQTVQRKGGAQYGLLFGQPDRYYQLEPLPVSAGGGVGATGEGNLEPAVNTDGWVKAMTYYRSLFADKVTPRGIGDGQTQSTFLAGKTAYIVDGDWMVADLAKSKLNWGAALNPVWEGGKPATPTGSWSVGMNPFSKNKEAAAIFLKWLAIDGGVGGYAKYWTAQMPANTAALKAYVAGKAFTGSEGGKQAAEVVDYESKNTAVGRVSTAGYLEFEDIINRAFSDIANGADPKTALDSAQNQLTTAWQQYK